MTAKAYFNLNIIVKESIRPTKQCYCLSFVQKCFTFIYNLSISYFQGSSSFDKCYAYTPFITNDYFFRIEVVLFIEFFNEYTKFSG